MTVNMCFLVNIFHNSYRFLLFMPIMVIDQIHSVNFDSYCVF